MASEKFSTSPVTKKRVSDYAPDSEEEVELKKNESKNRIPVAVADANATKQPAKTLKKQKKTTETHQPQSQGADTGDDPSTYKSKIISDYAPDSEEEVELKKNESKNRIPVAVADANATKQPAKTLKKQKKTTETHQPQSQGADNGDDPSTHKSKIIFKGFEARINEQGVQSDFLPEDTVAELVELWKSFKQAEFECSRREAHFSEKLFEAARDIYSSSY